MKTKLLIVFEYDSLTISQKEVQKLIDNGSPFHSNEYDKKIKLTLPYYEDFYKQIIDLIKIYNTSPLTWLDVGCGTGKMAELALSQANIKKFIFCDSSSEMLNIVKERFNLPNTEFLLSTIQELNYQDTFNIITSIQVNHYLKKEERITTLQNYYNALKPNGIYITFENFAPSTKAITNLYLERWKSYQIAQGKSPLEAQNHITRYNTSYYPLSLSDHLNLLKTVGFKTTEILWLSYMQVGILSIKE